jgi:hypothetical protein
VGGTTGGVAVISEGLRLGVGGFGVVVDPVGRE